uniref:Structural maintenance of chromosomes protein n=1 Tax=Trypanosoma congolense (strain IL3000) TaxID=1068625 RepID=G0UV86_TRYCI|nr:putative structural maintenance of chromosome 4 [Trypanosoma congolense IL3000]
MSHVSRGARAVKGSGDVTRLVIRDIDVENFKSYAGKHRIGPFHKTFETVVGPNGSGKSNVIDSMLFVFGKNARKIRLEKLSDLIHTSAAYPDFTHASVTVNFVRLRETEQTRCDPDYREEVEGSLFSIKREVHKTGTSQYFIQGVKKTQREVVDTLIDEGVDLEHNRFLILQGEVEQIALMKPKAERDGEEGLLEYLDDLIGTNDFAQRISDATREAEEAQQKRLDALDHERKLRAEREALDSAKESAIEFVKKDNLQQRTLIILCQLKLSTLEEKLAEPRRRLKEIQQRVHEIEEVVEEKLQEKSQLEGELHRREKDLAAAAKECDAVRAKRDAAERDVERIKSGADDQVRARKKKEAQIKAASDELKNAGLQQEDVQREIAIHNQNLEEAREAVERLQKEYDVASEKLVRTFTPLRQELDRRKIAFAPYEKAVVTAKEQLDTALSRLKSLDAPLLMQQERLQSIAVSLERDKSRIKELEKVIGDVDYEKYNREMRQLQESLAKAAEKKRNIDVSIQDIKKNYRDGETDDRIVKFLAGQPSLKGYYGTLRQLGRIDQKYDVAAGVASRAWSYHVVEDRKTATEALGMLRKMQLGRATMIVLSEIDERTVRNMNLPFKSPTPKAQRLFDLIQPSLPKYRIAFYQAVGNTLVVSGLTEAREVAFGSKERHRVVTLRGELAETGGSLTGGGAVPRGAQLNATISPQEKEAVKSSLEKLQMELVEAVDQEGAIQEKLRELRQKRQNITPEQMSRLQLELRNLRLTVESNMHEQTEISRELEHAAASNEQKRATLKATVEEAENQLNEAQQTFTRQRGAIEEIEIEIDNVGGEEYKALRQELKDQQKRLETEETSLRERRKVLQRLRAVQERKERDIAQYNEELRRHIAEMAKESDAALVAAKEVVEELSREFNVAHAKMVQAQSRVEESKTAVPLANKAVVEAQKRLQNEKYFALQEESNMSDSLQDVTRFQQKIEGCEAKIRENVDFYGVETLDLKLTSGKEDDDEDEEDDDDTNSDADEVDNSKRVRGARKAENKGAPPADVHTMSFRLSPEELAEYDYEHCVRRAKILSEEARQLNSMIDFRAIQLWRQRDAEHRKGKEEYLKAKEISDAADDRLYALKKERRDCFMECFTNVQTRLREVYQLLTHGGDADLELVDANDPFEGINFVVRPPKKSWKQISNLSGGEKTLSSLALIFALHHIKPTPIYVMDEIDAALDFRNVSIVANYILRQATGAQFIIISLRNNMFEMAHQLSGVFKTSDVARTVGLNPVRFQRKVLSVFQELKGGETASMCKEENEEERINSEDVTSEMGPRSGGRRTSRGMLSSEENPEQRISIKTEDSNVSGGRWSAGKRKQGKRERDE